MRFANADEYKKGVPFTLSCLRVGIVGVGYAFNLERDLEALRQHRH